MAKARMLHRTISLSKQVDGLPHAAQLLFTWMIAHADDEGRLKGGADDIKATVVPRKNWSLKKVEGYLEEIKKADLIYRWQRNEEWFVEFIKWEEFQSIRADRFRASNLPSFQEDYGNPLTPSEIPKEDQATPQLNEIKGNRIKSNKIDGTDEKPQKESSSRGIEKLRKTVYDLGLKKGETNARS